MISKQTLNKELKSFFNDAKFQGEIEFVKIGSFEQDKCTLIFNIPYRTCDEFVVYLKDRSIKNVINDTLRQIIDEMESMKYSLNDWINYTEHFID